MDLIKSIDEIVQNYNPKNYTILISKNMADFVNEFREMDMDLAEYCMEFSLTDDDFEELKEFEKKYPNCIIGDEVCGHGTCDFTGQEGVDLVEVYIYEEV